MTAPRRATPRDPRYATRGPYAAQILTALGRRPLPWQRAALDVALEVDARGRYLHPVVVWLVPRRAGKSVGVMGALHHRAMTHPGGARCFYTAQKGTAASDWFRDELLPPLTSSAVFAGRYTVGLGKGHEQVTWPHSGGFVRMFAPQEDALHGGASDLVVLDESWAHGAARGADLLQAVGPTQATRPGAQLWVVSAAGTAESVFLIDQLAAARAAVADGSPAVALLEHGVPDDEDATDPDVAARYHPAVGLTIDPAYLHAERARMGPDGFARAYGCFQPMAGGTSGRISLTRWAQLATTDPSPAGVPYWIGFDVTPDRDAAVVAAWNTAGRVGVEVLRAEPGTGWLLPYLLQLLAGGRRPRPRLVVDDSGLARDVADQLTGHGHHPDRFNAARYAAACAWFAEQANRENLTHRGQWELDDAVAAASTRPLGDGWAWSRRKSAAPIATLVAASVAGHAAYHVPQTRAKVSGGRATS